MIENDPSGEDIVKPGFRPDKVVLSMLARDANAPGLQELADGDYFPGKYASGWS